MRINAINAGSGIYAANNRNSLRKSGMQNQTETIQPQNINFQGNGFKLGLGAVGAILGGLVIGGPVGAIIGAAAGLKGAQLAEADEEAKKNEKDNKSDKNK